MGHAWSARTTQAVGAGAGRRAQAAAVLARLHFGLVLISLLLALLGLAFIHSATQGDAEFGSQTARQALFLVLSLAAAVVLVLVPYARIMRSAWLAYWATVVALSLLPVFGSLKNGAVRWYSFGGVSVQPAEVAKLTTIVALASYLRFRSQTRTLDGLGVPLLITLLPAALVLRQPDLGSSLVFWPVLLAMCWVAGAPRKSLLWVLALGAAGMIAAYFVLHDYQRTRIDVWMQHFAAGSGSGSAVEGGLTREQLLSSAYQPWQALIAIGSGGWTGFGIGEGPQNRFDFLPYRSVDYAFAVVAEETGWLGALGLLALQLGLALGLLGIAQQSRERFGRLLAVGVATYLATQTLLHVGVCSWLLPATGLPMPFISYGGTSCLITWCAVALALNVGARREPVLARDGFA